MGRFPDFEIGALPPLPGCIGVTAFVDPRLLDLETVAFNDGHHSKTLTADPRRLFWEEHVTVEPICTDDTWYFEGDSVEVSDA